MIDLTSAISLLLITIASAAICHLLAESRGRKPVFWGMMGVFFGPFAIPLIFILKKKNPR